MSVRSEYELGRTYYHQQYEKQRHICEISFFFCLKKAFSHLTCPQKQHCRKQHAYHYIVKIRSYISAKQVNNTYRQHHPCAYEIYNSGLSAVVHIHHASLQSA